MKTIKPLRLSVLTRVFENDGEPYVVVTILAGFPFGAPRRLLLEASLWALAGAELGKDAILDEGMSKLRGELLVTGRCFTAGAVPRTACSVRVTLGAIDKELYVVGDRRWGMLGASDPEPFIEMPIRWANAFGGERYAANPLGKGASSISTSGGEIHPLPNVEDPQHLVMAPGDRPAPAGFGAYDLTWPQRFSKVGTYDQAWLEERYPEFARDLDWSFFNTAPLDQQIDGYFRGDETFVIENMHPEKPRIEGALPGIAVRCFVNQKTEDGVTLREPVMRLDTVHLFPHVERGILVFRGVLKIREDDAADVLHLLAACEAMDGRKPLEHYQTVLAQRLDRKQSHLFALRDRDLMPPSEGLGEPDSFLEEQSALVKREGYRMRHERRKLEREHEKLKEQIRAQGLDPEEHLPPLPPEPAAPDLEEMPELVAEINDKNAQAEEELGARRAEAERQARAACAEAGVDYDAMVRAAEKDAAGPPKFSAKKELERLREMAQLARNGGVDWPELEERLATPNLEEELLKGEESMRSAYRKFAHHFPAASRLEGEEAARLREEVIEGHRRGQSFGGRDLTGADLSHLDLEGVDLAGAMLEAANLRGASLRGANLAGAVLARADLQAVDLTGAKLAGVNLGSANLRDAKVGGGVDLEGAVLAKADLSGADFTRARLSKADLSEATLRGTDLRGATATGLHVLKTDLSGARLSGVALEKSIFLEANVGGVDFSGANLTSSAFITCKGDGAVFREAKLDNLRLLADSSFAGADFHGASLPAANLRGTRLQGSDLTDADLSRADLSECDLTGARLDRAVAVEARFVKANLSGASLNAADLMQGILQKAKLGGADLEKANLYRADLAKVRGDKATSLSGANVKRVRFVADRRPDGQG